MRRGYLRRDGGCLRLGCATTSLCRAGEVLCCDCRRRVAWVCGSTEGRDRVGHGYGEVLQRREGLRLHLAWGGRRCLARRNKNATSCTRVWHAHPQQVRSAQEHSAIADERSARA